MPRSSRKPPATGPFVLEIQLRRDVAPPPDAYPFSLPIVRALDVARSVAGNVVLGAAIDQAREAITEGSSIAAPLRQSGEFPPMVTQMIEVGEQSGQLEAMLEKVAETYDEEVETTISRFTALLEPLLILLMVAIVLVIILATLVPLLDFTSTLS